MRGVGLQARLQNANHNRSLQTRWSSLCFFWRQLFREADEGEGFKCEEGDASEKKKYQ